MTTHGMVLGPAEGRPRFPPNANFLPFNAFQPRSLIETGAAFPLPVSSNYPVGELSFKEKSA